MKGKTLKVSVFPLLRVVPVQLRLSNFGLSLLFVVVQLKTPRICHPLLPPHLPLSTLAL